jgi:hypothetical protein
MPSAASPIRLYRVLLEELHAEVLDGDGRLVRRARLRQPEAVTALVLLRYLLSAFGGVEPGS